MDFAKRQLEKYGWTEGQGLGKDLSGIKTALKPQVKLNKFGVGVNSVEQYAPECAFKWWEDAFNQAASNINVQQGKEGVEVETISEDAFEISTVRRTTKTKGKNMQYGTFLKRATLAEGGSVLIPDEKCEPLEEIESKVVTLSDEQLFQACGGLTAHKAARHGHKLSGKLQRVKEQEEALLRSYQSAFDEESSSKTKKKKEIKEKLSKGAVETRHLNDGERTSKHKSTKKRKLQGSCEVEVQETLLDDETIAKEKKRKKKKKDKK